VGTAADGGLTKSGAGTLALAAANTYTGTTTVRTGTLLVNGSIAGSDAVSLESGARLEAGSTQALRNLTLANNSFLVIRPSGFKVLKIEGFTFDPMSRTDVNDNALVADYAAGEPSPLQAIREAVLAGYNNGSWTGPGIASSTAAANGGASVGVGFGEASTVLGPDGGNFAGMPVDGDAVLVRYTRNGDASLDGSVDFNDLVKLAQNYNLADGRRTWADGDFTYDGNVDFNDLVKLAQNYNASLPPAALAEFGAEFREDLAAAAAAQVPEPGAGVALVAAGAIVAGRRGRRRRRRRSGRWRRGSIYWFALAAAAALSRNADAALTFNVEPNGWPNAAHRNAAAAAIQSAVNRYNAYGDFGNYNIYVYYNAGIPTAQANYLGSIGFGGTYPNERVTMHELAHYLGSGTYGTPWDGARGEALIDQFDGLEATLQGDSQHFWPYGLNYDSEGAEINKQRQVAMVYAQRADMGIGSTANPSSWAATAVTLKASDPGGTSGFNHASNWGDNTFAHSNAAYSTGAFSMRTPEGYNSWTFVGNSLTVNPGGRLLYNGWGTTGVVTFRNLTVNGGTVRHDQFPQDVFQLAGKVTLASTATFEAANGNIKVSANIAGSGSLTKTGGYTLTLGGGNSYAGSTTINAGTLRLAPATPVASYTFDNVSGSAVINGGTGGSAMNGTLANGATIVAGGRFGNAVSLANGASVNINNPVVDLGNNTGWAVSAWVKTTTPGASILTKGDGAGWAYGNTIFYLGDGTAGGSGGIPSAVRWAGGFFQGSTGAAAVNNNNWHQVAYANEGGNYATYVDGVAQPLSPGNSGFAVPDIGAVVRLGVSTNTVAADGTVNFNGLLDSVQFYNQGLSALQIAALYQGRSVGPLPITTDLTIAGGATLDVNGVTQQIASLSGPAGSAVTLGAGQLTVGSATSTQFAGTISGAGGSLIKGGTGTLTLSGNNT
jgi:autotransporter-associated beta strand protein